MHTMSRNEDSEMTADEKIEMINLHERVEKLERRVFKWKHRMTWLHDNAALWVPGMFAVFTCFYVGYIFGSAFGFPSQR